MISGQSAGENPDFIIPEKINDTLNKTQLEKNYIKTHFDAIVVDTHNDFIWQVHNKGADLGADNSFTHSDIPKFKKGGVDVQVFAVWIPMKEVKRSLSFTKKQINRLNAYQDKYFNDFEIAKTYEDIIRITNAGKLCGIIGVEGGTAIENSVDNVNVLWDLGVRYIGLTWNNSNLIAVSAKDETEKGKSGGLTPFGIDVIKRMDDTGMLIDVSHLGESSFWDVMKTTRNPVIASHSNAYSINPHFRNLTDDQIIAIAKTGGVIHVNFYDEFLDKDAKLKRTQNAYQMFSEELNELNDKYGDDLIEYNKRRDAFLKEKNLTSGTTIEILLDHIDHIKKLVGVDHIGIGSDFDGGITPPVELYDATTYPILTKRLFERGYSEEEVKKILGGNFLRLFKQVCG